MAGLNLAGAQRAVENLMGDTILVTRGPLRTQDDDFDETSGDYIVLAQKPVTAYSGKGSISGRAASSTYGGATTELPDGSYTLSLPLASAPLIVGDMVVATASKRDPLLPGKQFCVKDTGTVGSYAVSRLYALDEVLDGEVTLWQAT